MVAFLLHPVDGSTSPASLAGCNSRRSSRMSDAIVQSGGYCGVDLEMNEQVLVDFNRALSETPDTSLEVAATEALKCVLQRSAQSTKKGLFEEIEKASEILVEKYKSSLSLEGACKLFYFNVNRNVDESRWKEAILENGERFAKMTAASRKKIATLGARFIREHATIMVHGYSRVVTEVLLEAWKMKKFNVLVTESRGIDGEDGAGYVAANILSHHNIPCKLILDSAIAYEMEKVDMCLVGAASVVENGGVINKIGTYQLAVVANAFGKPLYVAAESIKFARLYPLNQEDIPSAQNLREIKPCTDLGRTLMDDDEKKISFLSVGSDYTPPSYITLLFTDSGVLTTSAVSDELINLYR